MARQSSGHFCADKSKNSTGRWPRTSAARVISSRAGQGMLILCVGTWNQVGLRIRNMSQKESFRDKTEYSYCAFGGGDVFSIHGNSRASIGPGKSHAWGGQNGIIEGDEGF